MLRRIRNSATVGCWVENWWKLVPIHWSQLVSHSTYTSVNKASWSQSDWQLLLHTWAQNWGRGKRSTSAEVFKKLRKFQQILMLSSTSCCSTTKKVHFSCAIVARIMSDKFFIGGEKWKSIQKKLCNYGAQKRQILLLWGYC